MEANMNYQAKNYESLLGMKGFSDTLLKNHFKLYQGYVANTNKVAEELVALHKGDKTSTPQYGELSRRFGWEFNGMRLHEYYFGNMVKGGNSIDEDSALFKEIERSFGSFDHWQSDYRGRGSMRGIGWIILYCDCSSECRLFNVWVNEHDAGHLSGAQPLLIMDVFEHAFITDYGLNRADYIDAFLGAVDWKEVEGRFDYSQR
jgi:Fe-Mn family superoxide dismutase